MTNKEIIQNEYNNRIKSKQNKARNPIENQHIKTIFVKYKNSIFFISSSLIVLFIAIAVYFYFLGEKPESTKEYNIEEKEVNESMILRNEIDRQNEKKYKIMKFLEYTSIGEYHLNKEIRNKVNYWKNISNPYLGIERFSIPMISTISAGKSSTLNFLLNIKENKLEIGESITTKFCVIIRHKKNYKKGKIYNVTIEKRADINKYNFHKAEEIKSDIKTFIKERNELIQALQNDNKEIKDPSLYFIIMEIDTGLFEGEYEKYSQLIEFIDIPGLNEIGVENNFYFKNVLPLIKMNFLFPIIILDSEKFESTDVFNVLKEIFQPYISEYLKNNFYSKKIQYDIENQNYILKEIKENSLFLINKLNLVEKINRNRIVKKIINETSSEFKIDLNLDKNCFIINAKARNLEVNKYSSFLNYTEYIINKGDLEENIEIIDLLTEGFQKDFNFMIPENIDKLSIKSKKAEGYEEFSELIGHYKILIGKFPKSYFFYFNEKFKEFVKQNKTNIIESEGIIIKNVTKNKIKDLINKFINDNSSDNLLKELKIDEEDLNEDMTKYINKGDPLNVIHILEKPLKELKEIGIDNDGIIILNKDYEQLIKIIENNKLIHYIILGIFSSGKSFTLNNIIGYNYYLLEAGRTETTNHAFVVRYSKNITFYKAVLESNKYGYYFIKEKKLASGRKEVIDKIKEVNHNVKEFSYFILETPIQMFENSSIPEEILNNIEIIDYPGLDTQKAKAGNYANNSFLDKYIINGFFFINEPKNQKINSVKEVFKSIINKFIYGDTKVDDIKNCLFIFSRNNADDQSDFYKLNIKGQISSLIEELKKEMDMTDVIRIESKINESLINFVKFSNIDYKEYSYLKEILNTFESFISHIIRAKIKKIKKLSFQSLFENIDLYIKEKFELKEKNEGIFGVLYNIISPSNKKEKKDVNYHIDNIEPFINSFKNELVKYNLIEKGIVFDERTNLKIKKYAEKYLYLKDNLKNNENYKKSFYEDFRERILNIIGYSKDIIIKSFNNYLNDILTEIKGVINTIDKKFNMNQNEFKEKFSENAKKKIFDNIDEHFTLYNSLVDNEINKLKKKIALALNDLNCNGDSKKDAEDFENNFKLVKKLINIIIDLTSVDIQEHYQNFEDKLSKLIHNYLIDENESKQIKKGYEENVVRIETYFGDIGFVTVGYFSHFFSFSHEYKNDIQKACNDYKEMLSSSYQSIEKNIKEKFKNLENKIKDFFNLIFNTANSNFDKLKNNYEKFKVIKDFIKNI